MPTANQPKTLKSGTISASGLSDVIDTLGFTRTNLFWLVANGSSSSTKTITPVIYTGTSTSTTTITDWATIAPTEGTLTVVGGTGHGTAFPTAQAARYENFMRYIVASFTLNATANWSFDLTTDLKGVN